MECCREQKQKAIGFYSIEIQNEVKQLKCSYKPNLTQIRWPTMALVKRPYYKLELGKEFNIKLGLMGA